MELHVSGVGFERAKTVVNAGVHGAVPAGIARAQAVLRAMITLFNRVVTMLN